MDMVPPSRCRDHCHVSNCDGSASFVQVCLAKECFHTAGKYYKR